MSTLERYIKKTDEHETREAVTFFAPDRGKYIRVTFCLQERSPDQLPAATIYVETLAGVADALGHRPWEAVRDEDRAGFINIALYLLHTLRRKV